RLALVDSPELDTCGEDEHVRGKAVPAQMRGDPQLLTVEASRQRPEDRRAASRAAPVAAAVPTYEYERRVHSDTRDCEIDRSEVIEPIELDSPDLPPCFLRRDHERKGTS